ncbi:MAG: 50S ribosomal protein L3 [Candidatus Moraniibacteriota bacterium]
MKCLLGKKLGMTTLFDEAKGALNVTLIECEPNTVSLHRTAEKNGYVAVQLSHPKTKKVLTKREFRLDLNDAGQDEGTKTLESLAVASTVTVAQFAVGEKVHISGITKAKGFQGVVKRYGFAGGRASHGGKHDLRKPGSIGATFPEHVIKGRRMAGRMGADRFTVRNLIVDFIDTEKGILGVRGAVPGVAGRIVEIRSAK